MALIPADFKIRFPEFVAIDDSRIQFWLDDAMLEVGEQAWGELYEKGSMLLAAHLLALDIQRQSGGGGSGGGSSSLVTMRKVGDVQVSFARSASSDSNDDWYTQTDYGAEYLRLKLRVGMGAVAVGGF